MLKQIILCFLFSSSIWAGIFNGYYSYTDENITIEFPCWYTTSKEKIDSIGSFEMIGCSEGETGFGIAITEIPNIYGKRSSDILESAFYMGSKMGELVYKKWINKEDYLGLEYKMRFFFEGETAYALSRLYYIGGKVYSIKLIYKKYDKNLSDDFLNSFNLI